MLEEIRYAALSGKTRAMFGKLLHKADYNELIQKKSISEIVSYLKYNTHYASILSDVDESDIHRGHLENILKRDYIKDFAKLIKFTRDGVKDFTNLLYMKVEIESLKLIFRMFEAGAINQPVLEDSLLFLAKYDRLNIPKLALSRNTDEFLLGLKGSGYYEVLYPYIREINTTRLFSIEMALDIYYLRQVQEAYQKILKGDDSSIVKSYIGTEIDMFNIFWIYRNKNYYLMDKEVVQSYVIPNYYKIKKNTIEDLLGAKTQEDFAGVLAKTPYRVLFEGINQIMFERNYSEFVYDLYRTQFRRRNFSIACIVSYLRLKEMELSNIISIIEGIRYRLEPEQIQKFIAGMGI